MNDATTRELLIAADLALTRVKMYVDNRMKEAIECQRLLPGYYDPSEDESLLQDIAVRDRLIEAIKQMRKQHGS